MPFGFIIIPREDIQSCFVQVTKSQRNNPDKVSRNICHIDIANKEALFVFNSLPMLVGFNVQFLPDK